MITTRGPHREQRQAVSQGGHLLTTRTVLTQYTCIILLQHLYEYMDIYKMGISYTFLKSVRLFRICCIFHHNSQTLREKIY